MWQARGHRSCDRAMTSQDSASWHGGYGLVGLVQSRRNCHALGGDGSQVRRVAAAATAQALLCGISGTKVAAVGGPLGILINFLSNSLRLTMSSVLKDGATYQMGKTHLKSQLQSGPSPRRREWHRQGRHARARPERPQRARFPRAPCWTCREEVLWWPCHTSWLLHEYDTSTTPCNSLPSR